MRDRFKIIKAVKKEKSAYLFILPSFLMFLLFTLYPLILSLLLSFKKANLINAKWIGFANFQSIFHDEIFLLALKNTFLFVVILVPTIVFLAFFTALTVSKLNNSLKTFFRGAFYLPTVLSGVILSLIWLWIFNPAFGLLNYLVKLIGFKPVVWLASKGTIYYLMFVVFTFNFGVPVIIYLASIMNIPAELYEAARIDGASRREIKWKITFPLLKPTTFFLFVTQTIAVFQVWVVVQLLTNGGPAHRTETIVFQIYKTAFWFNQFGRASAMGMVLVILIIIVTILQKLYAGEEINY